MLVDDDFYLGKYEVTQSQWEAVMGTTPWAGQDNVREGPDYPAVYVSREDVLEFIERLNEAEGGRFYRLPTEAEWSKAARSYSRVPLLDSAVLEADAVQKGGSKIANDWRVYDMYGNVQEWVYDHPGSDYVVQGGAFNSPNSAANRSDSDHADAYTGFRLVRGNSEEWYAPLPPPPFVVLNEERAFSLPGTAEEMAFMRIEPGGVSDG